jgi:endonuclease-8
MASIVEPEAEIGAVLLDQRVACGVGNVFKSEVLWACRVDPFAPVATLDDTTRRRLVEVAHEQLAANVARPGGRVTHGTGVAVYRKRGRPCPRCGTPIRMRYQGELPRSTYWCPTCQPPQSGAAARRDGV